MTKPKVSETNKIVAAIVIAFLGSVVSDWYSAAKNYGVLEHRVSLVEKSLDTHVERVGHREITSLVRENGATLREHDRRIGRLEGLH